MEELTLEELIAKIKDSDASVRAAAWPTAGRHGAAAVKPLAAIFTHQDIEVARAAKRGLWALVRHVGRPGAEKQRKPVVAELCGLLGENQPDTVRREVLWMLSEIGGDETVAAIRDIPGILDNTAIREDARCTVERIPGRAAVDALIEGLEAASYDFQVALAESIRKRGVDVDRKRYPSQKLVPTKKTEVQPIEE